MIIKVPEMAALQVSESHCNACYTCASLTLQNEVPAGVLAAGPPLAEAISVPQCEQLITAGNGIQFCDTKEGTGKTPAKGAVIRCLPERIVCVLAHTC